MSPAFRLLAGMRDCIQFPLVRMASRCKCNTNTATAAVSCRDRSLRQTPPPPLPLPQPHSLAVPTPASLSLSLPLSLSLSSPLRHPPQPLSLCRSHARSMPHHHLCLLAHWADARSLYPILEASPPPLSLLFPLPAPSARSRVARRDQLPLGL